MTCICCVNPPEDKTAGSIFMRVVLGNFLIRYQFTDEAIFDFILRADLSDL